MKISKVIIIAIVCLCIGGLAGSRMGASTTEKEELKKSLSIANKKIEQQEAKILYLEASNKSKEFDFVKNADGSEKLHYKESSSVNISQEQTTKDTSKNVINSKEKVDQSKITETNKKKLVVSFSALLERDFLLNRSYMLQTFYTIGNIPIINIDVMIGGGIAWGKTNAAIISIAGNI